MRLKLNKAYAHVKKNKLSCGGRVIVKHHALFIMFNETVFCPQSEPQAQVSFMSADFIYPRIDCEPYTAQRVGGVPTPWACHCAENTWLAAAWSLQFSHYTKPLTSGFLRRITQI